MAVNQLRWGAALSYVNIFITLVVGLLYTPIMLRLLGQSEFGLYSLIGAAVGYLSILDLGLGNTIVRYTARNRAIGDGAREAELNGLFLAIYTVIGLLTAGIGLLLYLNLDVVFGTQLAVGELERGRTMVLLLVFNLVLTFPLSIFGSVLQAYERFVFLRVGSILRSALNPVIALPLLYMGYGSVMLVVVTTVLNVAVLAANLYYGLRYLHITFRLGHYERSFLYEVAGYSFFIFLNAVMDKVYWGTGQLVLGWASGTVAVAIYAIAMQFCLMFMQFSGAISSVLLPRVTMLVAGGARWPELTALMVRVGRLQLMVIGTLLVEFALVGREFITLWAGAGYTAAYAIALLIMCTQIPSLVQNAGIAILLALNKNRYRMTVYTVAALLSVAASIALAPRLGAMGVAVSSAVAIFVSTGVFMNRYYAQLGLDMRAFWRELWTVGRVLVGVLALGYGALALVPASSSWGEFSLRVAVLTLVIATALYRLVMNDSERALVAGLYRRFSKRGN